MDMPIAPTHLMSSGVNVQKASSRVTALLMEYALHWTDA